LNGLVASRCWLEAILIYDSSSFNLYLVKAEAKGYLNVEIAVLIESGRTTRVHLGGQWKPSTAMSQTELVSAAEWFSSNAGMN
jgi:hypothetical protein